MSACPSCGRDPGSNDICPHCGADLKHRIRIRNFGIASIVVAFLGLAVLWLFATHSPIAQVKIRDVESSFNYAYVQIDGIVSRGPSYNADSQSLTFYVRDDTGELMVSAFRSAADELIAADKIPAPGDTVSVQGTLRVREAVPSLNIDSSQALTLQRVTENPPTRDIGSITSADALHGVTLRGMVRSIKVPYTGLKLVTLRDATGSIDVAISSDMESLLGAAPEITAAQSIQVIGSVTLFDTTPQLTLNRGSDMSPLDQAIEIAQSVSIGDLRDSGAGRFVKVSGEVEKVSPFSAGVKVSLIQNDQHVSVLFWQDFWDGLSISSQITSGAQLSVQGEVNTFRGQIEIIPEINQDVALTALAPVNPTVTPTPTPTIEILSKPIGQITDKDVDSIVLTNGSIEKVAEFSLGTRYTLKDNTGSITLLMWSDRIDPAKQRELFQVGVTLSVTGKIDQFNGQLEIVPDSVDQVTVISTPSNPPSASTPVATPEARSTSTPGPTAAPVSSAPPATISQLSQDNAGQTYQVQATVVEVSSFSAGFDFLLDDGTGRIKLTLFNNTYKFVPGRSGLNLGAEVSVAAQVTVFKGALELQPKSGRDVVILKPGSNGSVAVRQVNSLGKPGEIVAVEGTLTDIKDFSAGKNIFVDDGTGNVQVTIFNNVLAYVPVSKLIVGATVRVVGKTGFFGRMQVVPQLGYDVIIQ
jgi:DNA/RNA endonuclease YhcR with UshA esterase domain